MARPDTMIATPAATWRPVGGALAASAALHALGLAALAAILLRPEGLPGPALTALPLTAVLVATPVPAESGAVAIAAAAPAPGPREPAARIPTAPVSATRAPQPWTLVPVDSSLPWSALGSALSARPRLDAGVEIAEMRNVALLGEDIERRIQRGFDVVADLPMTLKAGSEIGYPIDALNAGIEGRVLVWFAVDEAGKVVEREGLDGPQELRDWVLERLDQLIDKPARSKHDEGVRAWAALEVTFTREAAEDARNRLAEEAAEERSRPRKSAGAR